MTRAFPETAAADPPSPALAVHLAGLRSARRLPPAQRDRLECQAASAWGQEPGFGRAVAAGFSDLAGESDSAALERYADLVGRAGAEGPTYGRILAASLPPVLRCHDPALLEAFLAAVETLKRKGTYAMEGPLALAARWCAVGEQTAARSLAQLLAEVFRQPLSYARCQQLAALLPAEAQRLEAGRRPEQLDLLRQVMSADQRLAEPFLQGLAAGLGALPPAELKAFVDEGLRRHRRRPEGSAGFFALQALKGRRQLDRLQARVPFVEARPALERYLRARTGLGIGLRPLSALCFPAPDARPPGLSALGDGRWLYLPDGIAACGARRENLEVYKLLTRLEAGLWEWGTFAFALRDALRLCDQGRARDPAMIAAAEGECSGRSGLGRFLQGFADDGLALALFTLFEHARLNQRAALHYPGLAAAFQAALAREPVLNGAGHDPARAIFMALYGWIVPRQPIAHRGALPAGSQAPLRELARRAEQALSPPAPVERVAPLVLEAWELLRAFPPPEATWAVLPLPLGRAIRPDLFDQAGRRFQPLLQSLGAILEHAGLALGSDPARAFLVANDGLSSPDALGRLMVRASAGPAPDADTLRRLWQRLGRGPEEMPPEAPAVGEAAGASFRYPEWDCQAGDYLAGHVRVGERQAPAGEPVFFEATLERRRGQAVRLRRAFERLRPERLSLMRRWIEGDDLDPAALSDHLIARRAGELPPERVFIKRVKSFRDIASLLLVDISRSTAHGAEGGGASVLDIEKEAMVLFAEALDVLGDPFAIAAFSGSGPLGVEYLRVKDFEEPLDAAVKGRIGALAPRRNTRMGAAIRHAAARLEGVAARGRLLLLLGDGFPNDTGYRGVYGIEDTARALDEARARGVNAHALTVTPAGDGRLDRLYGALHYHMIADVRDLPAQLLRIYRHLTRR